MKPLAQELDAVTSQYFALLKEIPEESYRYKPEPSKWSKKEIIGHLIDSAQNNIRRFIVAQYEDRPGIVYNQDQWVRLNGYQDHDTTALLELWLLLNKQIGTILKNISSEAAQRQCQTQALHTIEWLAADYLKHLKHHLHQVLDLEPVAYP